MAVAATRRSGRRATPTRAVPAIEAASSPAAVTQTSTTIRVVSARLTSALGMPTRTVAPSAVVAASTRYPPRPGRSTLRVPSPLPGAAASRASAWSPVSGFALSWARSPLSATTFDAVTSPSSPTSAPNVPSGWPPPPTKPSGPASRSESGNGTGPGGR